MFSFRHKETLVFSRKGVFFYIAVKNNVSFNDFGKVVGIYESVRFVNRADAVNIKRFCNELRTCVLSVGCIILVEQIEKETYHIVFVLFFVYPKIDKSALYTNILLISYGYLNYSAAQGIAVAVKALVKLLAQITTDKREVRVFSSKGKHMSEVAVKRQRTVRKLTASEKSDGFRHDGLWM